MFRAAIATSLFALAASVAVAQDNPASQTLITNVHVFDGVNKGQQGGGLGHPAGATTGTETPLLAGKRYEPLEVVLIATHAQEPVGGEFVVMLE